MKNMFPEDFFETFKPNEKRNKPKNLTKHPKILMNINPPSSCKNKRITYYPIQEEMVEESITKSILNYEKLDNVNMNSKKHYSTLDLLYDDQQPSTSGSGSSVAISRGSQNNSNNIKITYNNPIFTPQINHQIDFSSNNYLGENYFYNSNFEREEKEQDALFRETPHFSLGDFQKEEKNISITKPKTPIIKRNQIQRNKTPDASNNKSFKQQRTTSMNKLQSKKPSIIQTEHHQMLPSKKLMKRPTTERFSRNFPLRTEVEHPTSEVRRNINSKNLTPNKNRIIPSGKQKVIKDNEISLPKILPHAKLENEINQLIHNVPENVFDDPELKTKFNVLMKNIDDIKKVIQRKNKAQNIDNKSSGKAIRKENNYLQNKQIINNINHKVPKKEKLFQPKKNM